MVYRSVRIRVCLQSLYKPLDKSLRYIALPSASARRSVVNVFDDNGNKLASVEVKEVLSSLELGRELGSNGAVFGGIRWGKGKLDVETGTPSSSESFDRGEWTLNATWDRLDNRYVPSSGLYLFADHIFSRKNVGADANFEQLKTNAIFVGTVKSRHTLIGGLRYNTTFNGSAPVQSFFRAGGLFNMSGFEPNELTGQHFGMGLLGYRYKLANIPLVAPYVGGTLEYGAATNDRDDIIDEGLWNGSLYLAFSSPLGPIYAGYGWRESDSGVVFIRIGSIFTR